MRENRKEFLQLLGALALLSLVSLYRQLSRRFLPDDPVRAWLVYAAYIALLASWGMSIRRRITQKNLRVFLLLEDGVMLFWLTIRFVQDAFLYRDLYAMRFFGYLICVPAVAVPLFGLYAAFGLGRGDDYRFPGKWYLLTIPAAALIAMAVTNELHHFMFSVLPGEPQPNLYFHPYVGIYLIYGWAFALVAARMLVIYRRNKPSRRKSVPQKLAPFLEIILLTLFCAPYTAASFWVKAELIEFSAGVFFIEAASWEFMIDLGLVPVNTQYERVFDRSTVAMQIVSEDGTPVVRSGRAPALTGEMFARLRRETVVAAPEGKELQLFPVGGGCLVWQRDVSQLNAAISGLRRSEAELKQESALLGQELKVRSEETAVREQNRIYNQLTGEVGAQLALLGSLLAKRDTAEDKAALFRRICLIGTYVKRRCSLRLTEQADGAIPAEDLQLSFRDLSGCLREMGVDAALRWEDEPRLSAAFSLLTIDIFEFLLEFERFSLTSVRLTFGGDASFTAEVRSGTAAAGRMPEQELRRMCGSAACEAIPGGYRAVVREGGN